MEYLSQKGVAFTERNLGRDPGARKDLMAMGMLSLPVLVIGEQKFSGLDPARIDAALAALAA
jgi:glutaredoxin